LSIRLSAAATVTRHTGTIDGAQGWATEGSTTHAHSMQLPARLPSSVLDLPIDGVRLGAASKLRELTAEGPVLLVFLRHFG